MTTRWILAVLESSFDVFAGIALRLLLHVHNKPGIVVGQEFEVAELVKPPIVKPFI